MKKIFLPLTTVRDNGIILADKICKDDFFPQIIYVSLRGGAYLGNVISEYYKYHITDSPILFAALVARSYTERTQQKTVTVDGWTYAPENLRKTDKVLLIDEIFDSGATIQHLVSLIMSTSGIPRNNIRIAVHDYKIRGYRSTPAITPDYYCNKYVIEKEEDDFWIHYLSHELTGLSEDEIRTYYNSSSQELLLSLYKKKQTNP